MIAQASGRSVATADLRVSVMDRSRRRASTLAAVLRGLRTQTGIVSAQFEDAGEALPAHAERLDADAILWWRLPPEKWTLKAKLPVVFEVLR